MTAHDPRVTLTEVLAAHVRLPMMHSQGCSCGWHASLSHPDLHRTHLAEQIEKHIAPRWTNPRVTLTEAEVERLCDALEDSDAEYRVEQRVAREVERIIAARLAPIRALADEWTEDYPSALAACNREPQSWWQDLRAALDAPVSASQDHDGAEGQADAHQAALADHFEAMTPEQRRAAINVPRRPR